MLSTWGDLMQSCEGRQIRKGITNMGKPNTDVA